MTAENLEGFLAGHSFTFEDLRGPVRLRHKLADMVVIAIGAVICGADDGVGFAAFGRDKERSFPLFLERPNAILAHDTAHRAALDVLQEAKCSPTVQQHRVTPKL